MSDMKVSIDPETEGNVNLVYILYFASLLLGVTAIVGVVMAYMGRGKGNALLDSHYTNQINIFWKMVLFSIIGALLSIVLIGFLIIIAAVVWFIVRCVKGIQAMGRNEPIEDPGRWGF